MKKFKQEKIVSLILKEDEDYELKNLESRKINECFYLSKKEFEKYQQENDVRIVGNIHLRQQKYKDPYSSDNPDKQIERKQKKHIIGVCELKLKDSTYKKFDMYEPKNSHCIGYASLGSNNFVRLTKNNLWLLFIILLLAVILACILSSCPKNGNPFKEASNQETITTNESEDETKQAPLCYFVPYAEKIVLDINNQNLQLINHVENKGNYYISFEVFVNGVSKFESGAISPGNMVEYNLWSNFDAGIYSVVCEATEYSMSDKEAKPQQYDLTTTVIIKK